MRSHTNANECNQRRQSLINLAADVVSFCYLQNISNSYTGRLCLLYKYDFRNNVPFKEPNTESSLHTVLFRSTVLSITKVCLGASDLFTPGTKSSSQILLAKCLEPFTLVPVDQKGMEDLSSR